MDSINSTCFHQRNSSAPNQIFQIPHPGLVRLQLLGAIYRPDPFVLILRYCVNLKAIRYESTSLNRIVADKSSPCIMYRAIVALDYELKIIQALGNSA